MEATKGNPKTPFLAFVSGTEKLAILRQFVAHQHWDASCIREGDVDTATDYLKDHDSPELLLVEIHDVLHADKSFSELAEVCQDGLKVIATSSINEFSFFRWLQEIGIDEYLLEPYTMKDVAQAVKNALNPAVPSLHNKPAETGKVTAIIGSRGGVGGTTLAVNLAYMLAAEYEKNTALFDLHPQLGTVALALDLEPGNGLRDALERPERIDRVFLDQVMLKYDDHLSILSAELPLEDEVEMSARAAEALLMEGRNMFSHVIVDLPRSLTPLTRYVLQHADHTLIVTDPTLAGMRDTMRFSDFMKSKMKIKPPLVVLNRVGLSSRYEISPADFEKGIKRKVDYKIPYFQEAFAAINRGEALAGTGKRSPVLNVLHHIAADLDDGTLAAEEQPESMIGKMAALLKGKSEKE